LPISELTKEALSNLLTKAVLDNFISSKCYNPIYTRCYFIWI